MERRLLDWDQGLGRPRVLPLWKAVVVLCFLLRHNAVQEMAGELFGLSQPMVSRYGTLLRPVVCDCLRQLGFGIAPRGEPVLVDGFLAPCWDWKATEQLFSAKHRRTGHNIQVISDLHGRLREVGQPLPGARHDAHAYTASGAEAAVGRRPGPGDKGYQGSNLFTPYKKPLHRSLTEVEKDCNRAHPSIRSAVERCIGHLENWKILSENFRRPLDRFPEILETVTQLELLRTWTPS
ncbi:transposase family protein [Streptomyces sp. NPDC094438]|uniref:transposase family protein n=1 Tax=Streptomyces sp. NPDC094438 TaxID=3366061 RepID=UPI0037FCD674